MPTQPPESGPDFRTNPRSMDRYERFGMDDRVIAIGFWINAVLMVMKLLAGHFGHSEAVFADGMESAADFVAILASIIALKIGRKPFDHDHPYGHGKAESIAAILVSLIIFATTLDVFGAISDGLTTTQLPAAIAPIMGDNARPIG